MTNELKRDADDDQELANALAGITVDAPVNGSTDTGINFEETQAPSGAVIGSPFGEPAAAVTPVVSPVSAYAPAEPVATTSLPTPINPSAAPSSDPQLDSIKKDALNELRPLVDKLNVPPEEKFDTYLLLLRSTDDTTLIAPAHEAAKEIPDEARRAQALLDVIKEIDFLSAQEKA